VDIQAYIQSGIIESYVLGIATAAEAAEVEQLALQYPEVQDAIDSFCEDLEQKALENAIPPPPGIKEKILQIIRAEEAEQQTATPLITPAYPGTFESSADVETARTIQFENRRGNNTWKYLAAASIILFIASAAYNFYLYNQFSERSEQYQALLMERNTLQANNQVYQTQLKEWNAAAAMMADPNMAVIKMPGIKGKEDNMATVIWDTKTKDVYVVANKLPAPSRDKQYQLWAIVDGKPVDAGMIDPSCTSMCKMKNIPKAQAFAITLENAGGSPNPTMEQMFVMGKV
jgi:anti-sigma-K factor RskA